MDWHRIKTIAIESLALTALLTMIFVIFGMIELASQPPGV